MRYAVAGTVRRFGLIAAAVIALGGAGAGWAQQAPKCDMAKAAACTDQKVVECLNQHKGNQTAISQCQMQQKHGLQHGQRLPELGKMMLRPARLLALQSS